MSAHTPSGGNVFSSMPFLESLAAARFPGKRTSTEDYDVDGRHFRLLTVEGRAVHTVPWLDFHEAVNGPAAARRLRYLPRVATATMRADEWLAEGALRGGLPSPFVDWTFAPSSRESSNSRRRWRGVIRALGEAVYAYDDEDRRAVEQCVAWKRAQYRASGLADALADPRSRRLLWELRERGLLVTSTLRAGGSLLAAHVGMVWEERLYWWIPSYDPARADLSVGRVLLESLLEDSRRRGHREFDFLLGDESYKWKFATHTRVVGPAGVPPLALRMRVGAKSAVRRVLGRAPVLWSALQTARRRLRAVSPVRD